MGVRQIVPGCFRISMFAGSTSAYVVIDGDNVVVIDAGLPKKADRVLDAVRAAGRRPADVTQIVVTHSHVDHIGSLAAVAAATQAPVGARPPDADDARAGRTAGVGQATSFAMRLLVPVFAPFVPKRVPPTAVERELSEGEELAAGLRVLATPGHTGGHLSLLWPRHGGVLIGGDAASTYRGRPAVPPVVHDLEDARDSIRKIAKLEFEVACFAHGRPILSGASRLFQRLADRL